MTVRPCLAVAAALGVMAALAAPGWAQGAEPPRTLTLQLRDAPLQQALGLLFSGTGRQFQIEGGASGAVNAALNEVTWDQALRAILDSQGLTYRIQDNVYHIARPAPRRESAAPQSSPQASTNRPVAAPPGGERLEVIVLRHGDPAAVAAMFGGASVGFPYGAQGLSTYGIGTPGVATGTVAGSNGNLGVPILGGFNPQGMNTPWPGSSGTPGVSGGF